MSLFHDIVNEVTGVNQIKESKQMMRGTIIFAIVGTGIVLGVCVIGMYLRFRVFGG